MVQNMEQQESGLYERITKNVKKEVSALQTENTKQQKLLMMDVQVQMAKLTEQINLKMQEAKKDISKLLAWQAKLSVHKFESILNEKFMTESGERADELSNRRDKLQMED